MNEMIERVIKVITGLEGCNTNCMHCKKIAIATIEAMREPTEKMISRFVRPGHGVYGDVEAKAVWIEMINEALKDEEAPAIPKS